MSSEEHRRRIVAAALALTKCTHIEPCVYELMLLDEYVYGSMSIDKVIQELEVYNEFIIDSLASLSPPLLKYH